MDKLARPADDMRSVRDQRRRELEREGLSPREIDRALQADESVEQSRERL